MRKFAALALLVTSLCIVSSCGPNKDGSIRDYYGDYTFVLPFDHTVSNKAGAVYFETDYSMEQMVELINEVGYNASLHAIGDVKTILIAILQDGFSSYFVVYDKNYFDPGTRYTLTGASSNIKIDEADMKPFPDFPFRPPWIYVFLAPIHMLDDRDYSDMKRVYGSFEDIAEFYRATGKDDVVIDDVNKTVQFWCAGNPWASLGQGMLIMQYTETETGNYLEIKPLPVE